MTDITRRTTLYGIAAASVALAGCAETVDPTPGDRNGTDGADGDPGNGSEDGDGTDGDDGDVETAVQQVGEALSGPVWDRERRRGFCALVTEEHDAAWLLRNAPEETVAFVEETDFSESVLAYVESVGPTTCHGELSFADVGVEDGTLVASATVGGPDDDEDACGEAITFSGAFLRVTTDARPESARVSITDGWDETATVRSDDPLIDPDGLRGDVRPDGDPPNVPASFECDVDGFERHPQGYEGEVNWGGGGGAGSDAGGDGPLVLRITTEGDDAADNTTVLRGNRFWVELTNVSAREVHVGNQGKYNLEVRTESGWTELRGADGDAAFEYTDEAIGVSPGESLEWEFELTESGLVEDGPHADALRVCPDLVPGRYRFVFWGAADLAVAFDYEG
ncbi:hypothetical protein U4E84_14710 [Halorubrum sp. AD140]|uniref:hypothetical protein n=1 Tax=Halorubrum sp. AD140 TaxID=3050073 RepID=UPI002ACCCD36|nr:hypothetical protein [Halorubrum sp. AD140]MDZ5812597.1 hypothetical protein [Halorubrum sp. AD140]